MTPIQAVTSCFKKYFQFSGRASRSEYWWFFLATLVAVYGSLALGFDGISTLFWLATIVPWLAVSWRRLHDSNLAGPWLFIPIIMIIVSVYGYLFSILIRMLPQADAVFPDIEVTDETTLGELRESMVPASETMFENAFELGAANIMFILLAVASAALAIYLKTRPSTPGSNRFGPNPTEVPS